METKICICAFDMLYLNNQSLLKLPLISRRTSLRQSFKEIEQKFMFAHFQDMSKFDEVRQFLDKSVQDQCEGLMIKTLEDNASYEPSKRSSNWFKLKKDYLDSGSLGDSLDLVVVGADWGKGKRAGMFGSYLLACYEPYTGKY
jgi:DNA ligase-1